MTEHSLSSVVAANIRRLRQIRGQTAEEFAAAINAAGVAWTRQTVAKIENGRRAHVTVDDLAALAAALGIDDPWALTQQSACAACHGVPPAGYACLECGAETPRDKASHG
jgi:transcriptional regulator with XRE-family HTH domain